MDRVVRGREIEGEEELHHDHVGSGIGGSAPNERDYLGRVGSCARNA
jgi:hypothetical protein